MFQLTQQRWFPSLRTLIIVLASLLVIVASLFILNVVMELLGRFSQTIFLFFFGALLAYLLSPLVDRVQRLVRIRWLAILAVYIMAFIVFVIIGVLLFAPFVQQSDSLIQNLKNPSGSSLQTATKLNRDLKHTESRLKSQQSDAASGLTISNRTIKRTRAEISTLRITVSELGKSSVPVSRARAAPAPKPQTSIPPRYITSIRTAVNQLSSDYSAATKRPSSVDTKLLGRSVSDLKKARTAAKKTYNIVANTPLLLLSAQSWLDQHGIQVDLHARFGQAIQQISNSSGILLNNAVSILLHSGTILVNAFLIFIISFYFLSDGKRLIRKLIGVCPERYQSEAGFFLSSLDKVMGGYIRGQLILASIAGILGGGGAFLLGVPYPVLIGISTFALALVPVIGPVILIIPPVLIAVIFTSPVTALIMLIYFLVFMQLVTNVVGPRIIGTAVGIHPLEAMGAALVGYPIAGFLGSFLAVPTVGFIHIIVREARRMYLARESLENAEEPPPPEATPAAS